MGKYTVLQEEQIELGRKHGLLKEEIRLYKHSWFNYLQMEQIRLGFEGGLSEKEVRRYAHVWVPQDKMEEMRHLLKEGDRAAVPYYFPGGFSGREILFFIGILLLMVVCLGSTLLSVFGEKPDLFLKEDTVVLECGEVFRPQDYVASYSGRHAQIYYPRGVETLSPQEVLMVYRVGNEEEMKEKVLRLQVVDRQAPELVLTRKDLEVERGEAFSCMAYVEKAEDAVNGDLRKEVQCENNLDPMMEEQDILYTVCDKAGNRATEVLTVTFVKPQVIPEETTESEGEEWMVEELS